MSLSPDSTPAVESASAAPHPRADEVDPAAARLDTPLARWWRRWLGPLAVGVLVSSAVASWLQLRAERAELAQQVHAVDVPPAPAARRPGGIDQRPLQFSGTDAAPTPPPATRPAPGSRAPGPRAPGRSPRQQPR